MRQYTQACCITGSNITAFVKPYMCLGLGIFIVCMYVHVCAETQAYVNKPVFQPQSRAIFGQLQHQNASQYIVV